jgi:ankyrin repeat protein
VTFQLNLEQLRKQAKDRVRERRAAGQNAKLADVQFELARELGFPTWPKLKVYIERLGLEQPFHTNLGYYEGRADGIASVNGVSVAEARRDLAGRHGFASWRELRRHVEAMRNGQEPPTPFVLAYQAVEASDHDQLRRLLDRFPDLVAQRGTNGNDLLGMAEDRGIVSLLLERGADPNRGNDYGWTKLHSAGYGNDRQLARLLLKAGARTDVPARGDGGTPLVVALFWGHREVSELLGCEPINLRVAASLGDLDLIRQLAGTPAAGAHRGFYRPHGGFPAWQPSDDPQEVLDEALVWAAKAGRVDAIRLLVELGANVDADPYRGTPLTWAATNGRVESIRALIELGANPNHRGGFGGPDHGNGVTAIHLAAQSGQRQAVLALLDLGADPLITDDLHGGTALGWARAGGHEALADILLGPVPPRNDDAHDVDAAEMPRPVSVHSVSVHSILPDALAQAADAKLQAVGVQHVAHGTADPVNAAAAAADDPQAVALLGPYRSGAVAEAVLATGPAGLALLAPVATWAGVTRDDEPGCDIPAKHRGTVLRLLARDTEVARRLANHLLATGQRALVIAGAHDYGRQLDGQLRVAGLPRAERADDADLIVLAGLAGQPEIAAAAETAPLPVIAFDGVQGATLGDRDVRLALPYAPVDGVPTNELLAGVQQARHAAELVTRALAEGATDRHTMLDRIRQLGGFDSYGDPPEPPVWLWRADHAWNLQPDRPI